MAAKGLSSCLRRVQLIAPGLLACAIVLSPALAMAQSGIFSIFRAPQTENALDPFLDAEEDVQAYIATGAPLTIRPSDDKLKQAPQISAAPGLPLPPRRSTPVAAQAVPTPPPPAAAGSAVSAFAQPQATTPLSPPAEETEAQSDNPRLLATLTQPNFPTMRTPVVPQQTTQEELEAEERRTPEPRSVEKQTPHVNIACLKPELMALMEKAGKRFGATPVITSGQRSRGRSGSYHRRCMAADFFVPGVARADLARYLRSMPGAGGVGTYCHTKSVHIDIGEPRNWSQCGFRFRFSQRS
ncbi:MAG: YcbK family protein [Rhabdaerophilum sp.]